MPRGPPWILKAAWSSSGCAALADSPSDPDSSSEWDPGQKKALQQVQAAIRAALPLPADPVVPQVPKGDAVWCL